MMKRRTLRVYRIPFSTNVDRIALAAEHKRLAVEWFTSAARPAACSRASATGDAGRNSESASPTRRSPARELRRTARATRSPALPRQRRLRQPRLLDRRHGRGGADRHDLADDLRLEDVADDNLAEEGARAT